jgi:hypothetical protein
MGRTTVAIATTYWLLYGSTQGVKGSCSSELGTVSVGCDKS